MDLLATQPCFYAQDLPASAGLPVAQSEDGDLLVVDPEQGFFVGVVYHDDLPRVERTGPTIDAWLEQSTPWPPQADPGTGPVPETLWGRWRAVAPPGRDDDDYMPLLEIVDGVQWNFHWTWPIGCRSIRAGSRRRRQPARRHRHRGPHLPLRARRRRDHPHRP